MVRAAAAGGAGGGWGAGVGLWHGEWLAVGGRVPPPHPALLPAKPRHTRPQNLLNGVEDQPMYFNLVTSLATAGSLCCFAGFVAVMVWKGMLVL